MRCPWWSWNSNLEFTYANIKGFGVCDPYMFKGCRCVVRDLHFHHLGRRRGGAGSVPRYCASTRYHCKAFFAPG